MFSESASVKLMFFPPHYSLNPSGSSFYIFSAQFRSAHRQNEHYSVVYILRNFIDAVLWVFFVPSLMVQGCLHVFPKKGEKKGKTKMLEEVQNEFPFKEKNY